MYVYRVTRINRDPHYWKPPKTVKIVTDRSLKAQIKHMEQWVRNAERNGGEVKEEIVKVERALVGEWEDVDVSSLQPGGPPGVREQDALS